MIGFRLEMSQRQVQDDSEAIYRAARVAIYKLQHGAFVEIQASSRLAEAVLELLSRDHPLRVDPGMAEGALDPYRR